VKEMNDTPKDLLNALNVYNLGGEPYDQAVFYYAHGRYENSLGMLLLLPDSERKRNLAKNICDYARECHQLDYAYIAAHISGEHQLKKKIENLAKQDHLRKRDSLLQSESLDARIRKMAGMNGEKESEHQQRYNYCKRRVIVQIQSFYDQVLNNILHMKSCIRNGNGALFNYFLNVMTPKYP